MLDASCVKDIIIIIDETMIFVRIRESWNSFLRAMWNLNFSPRPLEFFRSKVLVVPLLLINDLFFSTIKNVQTSDEKWEYSLVSFESFAATYIWYVRRSKYLSNY